MEAKSRQNAQIRLLFSRYRIQATLPDERVDSEINRRIAAEMSLSLSNRSFQNCSHRHGFKQYRNRYKIVVNNGNLQFV